MINDAIINEDTPETNLDGIENLNEAPNISLELTETENMIKGENCFEEKSGETEVSFDLPLDDNGYFAMVYLKGD